MKHWFKPRVSLAHAYRIISHVLFFYFLTVGTLQEWTIVLLIVFVRTVLGTVIHRLLAHRSFTAPMWFEYLATIIASLGNAASVIAWVALHREHHRFSDTVKDPHSPKHKGYATIQFLGSAPPNIMYVPDLLKSKFHIFCHQFHWLIFIIAAMILFLIDPNAILYALIVPSVFIWHFGSAVNNINHSPFGYRNFDTKDSSVNNILTGIILAGEGWHNNHHHDPKDPQFGKRWWELDLGWQLIKLIKIKDS